MTDLEDEIHSMIRHTIFAGDYEGYLVSCGEVEELARLITGFVKDHYEEKSNG